MRAKHGVRTHGAWKGTMHGGGLSTGGTLSIPDIYLYNI